LPKIGFPKNGALRRFFQLKWQWVFKYHENHFNAVV